MHICNLHSPHWESRVLSAETMDPVIIDGYNVYSNFTWAYFEDSGWYKVNYTFVNIFHEENQIDLLWGKGQYRLLSTIRHSFCIPNMCT